MIRLLAGLRCSVRGRALPRSGVAALCALGLALAGCGGDDDEASAGKDGNEPVKLEVWDWGVPAPEFMNEINAEYEAQHPNVTIKHVVQPFDSYFTLMRSVVAAGKGPDIFGIYATPAVFDYQSGVLPLGDYVTDEQRSSD